MDVGALISAAGGPAKISRAIKRTHSSVLDWKNTGRVPPIHVLKMEELTGVPRHEIRPDIYPPPDSHGSSAAPDRDIAA